MGIEFGLLDNDRDFHNLTIKPIILNDLVITTEEDKNRFNDTIYNVVGSDTFNNVPKCQCQMTQGRHLKSAICPNCQTPVQEVVDDNLETFIWARAPKNTRKFIHPHVWVLLRNFLSKFPQKFDLLMYLCDPDYRGKGRTEKVNDVLRSLAEQGLEVRNYAHFYDNFYKYVEFFFFSRHYKQKKKPVNDLYWVIQKYSDRLFCEYIQIPNKSLLIMEKSGSAFNYDSTTPMMIDAIRTITGIDSGVKIYSDRIRFAKIARFLNQFANYHEATYADVYGGKPGLLRRQLFGSRSDFSFRAVITSLSTAHDYDEIHIPWQIAINVFKIHLQNKLLKMGFNPNQIADLLDRCALTYHPLIDQLFKEIIAESKYKGIPTLMNRNPSLMIGSYQLVYITKVKNGLNGYDMTDVSVSLSCLTVGNNNADFDGDEMNFMLLLDNMMAELGKNFASEMNVFNMRSINGISSSLNLPKPVSYSTAKFLNDEPANSPETDQILMKYAA